MNKSDDKKTNNEKHVCEYTIIYSSNGNYKICKTCNNMIILFQKV